MRSKWSEYICHSPRKGGLTNSIPKEGNSKMLGFIMNNQKQPSGKVKRVTVSPLTERDVLLLEKIAEKWKSSESKVAAIAIHEWLKNGYKDYGCELLQS
tara:strand:- start:229 stop:525 length:297 start_codon:yes stop_codon:yes gene_type:complete